MQMDVHLQYEEALDLSHHGHPTVVETVHTGSQGQPPIFIDPDFLQWAYGHRSVSGIAWFLHISCWTVQKARVHYGIAEAQDSPFRPSIELEDLLEVDTLLDPQNENVHIIQGSARPSNSTDVGPVVSFTGPLSTLCDEALDAIILQLRAHFCRAGISMLDGMLRWLGHQLPCDQIRESLMCIDPVHHVFQHIRIHRQVYSVPGPNSLWHHNGQHGEFFIFMQIYM